MAIDFIADLVVMLDEDDFAVVGVFTPSGKPHPSSKSVEINVIYDTVYLEIGNVAGNRPTASGSTAVFCEQNIDVGAKATINNIKYSIIDAQPDGVGVTMMVLQRI